MRLVLDTNVLIAAFIARGTCADLLEHCVLRHQIVGSEAILDEFQRHLVGKFKLTDQAVSDAMTLLRSKMELVVPVPLENAVCRDPDDDMVLATALSGHAECIVTGDKDLLVLQRFLTIEIVRPGEFVNLEARRGGDLVS